MKVEKIERVALNVKDIDAEVKFFQTFWGLNLI